MENVHEPIVDRADFENVQRILENAPVKRPTEPPTLADYIQSILSRKAQTGETGYSQSLYNLKDAAKMLNFLQANNIMDMER